MEIIREHFTVNLDLSDGKDDVLLQEGVPCTRASFKSILPRVENAKSVLVPPTDEQLIAEFGE